MKCLAQEHNTMSPARALIKALTRSARFGVERANHEATAPPTKLRCKYDKIHITPSERRIVKKSNNNKNKTTY